MPDGSVYEEDRKNKALVEGSVPHIFPNLPKYLSKRQSNRKSPKKRYAPGGKRTAPESTTLNTLQKQVNPLLERYHRFKINYAKKNEILPYTHIAF
jgi:hypothetical protein